MQIRHKFDADTFRKYIRRMSLHPEIHFMSRGFIRIVDHAWLMTQLAPCILIQWCFGDTLHRRPCGDVACVLTL
jgi:hypothetical protein